MTTKVEPTVEKVKELRENYEHRLALAGLNADNVNYDKIAEVRGTFETELLSLLSHSVQEAKAERDTWWKKELASLVLDLMSEDDGKKAERVGQKIHDLLSSLNTNDSLKQEEEVLVGIDMEKASSDLDKELTKTKQGGGQ